MSENLNSDQHQQLLFMMLLQQHEQIAMMGLGKLKSPASDKIERDLKTAKYAIDTLVMLEKFTSGNLSRELSNYLTQILTNLRLNYADEKKKDSAGAPKTEERPKKEESPKTAEPSENGGGSKNDESSKKGDDSKTAESPKNVDSSKKEGSPKNGDDSKSKDSSKKGGGSKSEQRPKNGD